MIQPMDNAVKAANKIERIFSENFAITPRISANAGVLFSQTARDENLVMATREVVVELPIDMPLEDGSQPRVRADFREWKEPPAVLGAGRNWGSLPESIQARMQRQLRLAARKQVLDGGLLPEAEREFRARLEALGAQAGCVFVFNPKAP